MRISIIHFFLMLLLTFILGDLLAHSGHDHASEQVESPWDILRDEVVQPMPSMVPSSQEEAKQASTQGEQKAPSQTDNAGWEGTPDLPDAPTVEQDFKEMPLSREHVKKLVKKEIQFQIKQQHRNLPVGLMESMDLFPSLHPLIIHFPVVLINLAFPLYLIAFIYNKEQVRVVAAACAVGGFIGALTAAYIMHPVTVDLSENATRVLAIHDFYAYLTVYVSGFSALVTCLVCLKKFQKKVFEIFVTLALLSSIATVTVTGHYGAMLTHIYGVGPQGFFLAE